MRTNVNAVLVGKVAHLAGCESAIGKQPVAAPLYLGKTGFEGDQQADRRHHGGPDKAVHHYAYDHYDYWTRQLGPRAVLRTPGAFGENLSSFGVTEEDVCIGDIFTLGTATLQVSQSRQPCWKLNLKFDHPKMSRLLQQTGKTGWYYRVLASGWVTAGDTLALAERRFPEWPLSKIIDVLYRRTMDSASLEALTQIEAVPEAWRHLFQRRLEQGTVEPWDSRLTGPD